MRSRDKEEDTVASRLNSSSRDNNNNNSHNSGENLQVFGGMEQQQRDRSSCAAGGSTARSSMRLSITSTTGSPVELTVPRGETVDGLRTQISQRLRLQRNRTVLLHRDRQLTAGKLLDLGVTDGSKLTLVPVIEAGLVFSATRGERTVMDVLESFTELQISDFLSGRSPLTINIGIGDRVMYVQLQLSSQDVKKLQLDEDVSFKSNSGLGSGLRAGPDRGPETAGSTTSPAPRNSNSAPEPADSSSIDQSNIQRSRTSPKTHSSTSDPAVNCQHSFLPQSHHSVHTRPPAQSSAPSPSSCPHPSSPLEAAASVCSPAPTGSSPGPPSPVPGSTFEKSHVHASSTAERCMQPGAVIESFVNHSPGVYSGTFSGRLAPSSQSGISCHRRGINIILQILGDLLRAACYHQAALPTLSQRFCPVANRPVSPVLPTEQHSKTSSEPLVTQRAEHNSKTSGEANLRSSTEEAQALHCKLERLQSLLHQRRLRRRIRRSSHLSPTSHPYQHRQHHP